MGICCLAEWEASSSVPFCLRERPASMRRQQSHIWSGRGCVVAGRTCSVVQRARTYSSAPALWELLGITSAEVSVPRRSGEGQLEF